MFEFAETFRFMRFSRHHRLIVREEILSSFASSFFEMNLCTAAPESLVFGCVVRYVVSIYFVEECPIAQKTSGLCAFRGAL